MPGRFTFGNIVSEQLQRKVKILRSFFSFFLASAFAFSVSAFAFEVYDETTFLNKPDMSKHGMVKKTRIIYAQVLWKKGEESLRILPPKQRVIDLVTKKYANYSDTLIADLEQWKLRGTDEQIAESVHKYITIAGWIKSAAPKAKIGLYGRPPFPDPHKAILGPEHPKYKAWQLHNDKLAPISNAMDVLAPNLYVVKEDPGFWVKTAAGYVSEAKRLGKGKPIYPFLNPHYHNVAAPLHLRGKPIPKDFFLLQLKTLKNLGADGAIIWAVRKTTAWDENAPWWLATKEFLGPK